ncbi:MAG: CoA transferase [Actinobacteria bacterium]|nr:CoA transferase [Actinomycetota bacterium]
MAGPLEGIRVVEFATTVSGPSAGQLLAEQGAEVIKVESHDGDVLRGIGAGTTRGHMTGYFASFNRGKRSIVVDVKDPDGAEIVRRLADGADVFLQNQRPGVVERLGLAPADLLARNPDLIYVSISGVGPTGPYAHLPFYDPMSQALSGMAALQADTEGRSHLVRTVIGDKVTGMFASQAALNGLVARGAGKGGQHIEVRMLDAMIAWLFADGFMHVTLTDDDIPFQPNVVQGYDTIVTRDGAIVATIATDAQFAGVWRALGRPEVAEDPKWKTVAARSQIFKEAFDAYASEIATFPRDEIVARLRAEDVPAAEVLEPEEVFTDPQVLHNEVIDHVEHPVLGGIRQPRVPVSYGATPVGRPRHAPMHGEHTDEVLGELGYGPEAIAGLRARGIVAGWAPDDPVARG